MCKSDNANASVRISSSPLQLIQCWLFICECEREWEWERVKWPNRSLVFDLVYVRPFSLCMANCQTVFFVQFVLIRTAKMRLLLERMPATGATFTQSGASWPSFIQRNIQIPFHERIILIPPLFLSLSIYGSFDSRVCGLEAMESKSKSKWNYCCKQEQLHHSQHHSAATQSPLYWWLIFSLRSPGSSLRQWMLCKQVDRQTYRQADRHRCELHWRLMSGLSAHPEELRVDLMLWQRSQQVLPASHQAAAPLFPCHSLGCAICASLRCLCLLL